MLLYHTNQGQLDNVQAVQMTNVSVLFPSQTKQKPNIKNFMPYGVPKSIIFLSHKKSSSSYVITAAEFLSLFN